VATRICVFDLLIVGCGPVGAVAANLAGTAGLSTCVVDRAEQVFDLPRAIHFDAHVMRILQQAGLADQVLPATRIWKRSTFYGADQQPIRVHEWPQQRPQGWDEHYLFYQPKLEELLRENLSSLDAVEARLGLEVSDISQTEDAVTVRVRDGQSGQTEELTARFVLAADGASSFVRSHHGIRLLDQGFHEAWMVIDVMCERQLGIAGESEMFCDPRRPATRIPGPGHHYRWEFMLLPGETPDSIQQPEAIADLLSPWVTTDEVQILRAAVYTFHALVAERWREGRVFLVGDAAHQTPVFLGQGLCHGIRDVHNLIWKISAMVDGHPTRELLDSFEAERRPHVERIITMAVNAGRDICLLDPVAAAERDTRMRSAATAGKLPGTTFQGMPPLSGGLFTRRGAGTLFPQPTVQTRTGQTGLMDDVVGAAPCLVTARGPTEGLADLAATLGAQLVTVTDEPVRHAITAPVALADWMQAQGGDIAVIRPDRYVHAITTDADEAADALKELCAVAAICD
jgi:3-(3-hydroxy-phenyl)propionate hydroxylase